MGENWVVESLNSVLSLWNRRLSEIYRLLVTSPKDFKGGRIFTVMASVNDSVKAVGLALVVLFFLFGIVRTTSDFDQIKKPEQALKLFIRFAIARFFVTYGLDLMLKVYAVIQGILSIVLKNSGLSGLKSVSLPGSLVKIIEEASFIESIPLWAVTILASVAILVLSIVLILSVYGRFFRIYMYTALSPIPLSTLASSVTQQSAIAFIKSYVGVCMEGVVIIVACIIYSAFIVSEPVVNASSSPVTQVFSYSAEMIFNMLILVGTVRLSDRITKEMMGL